MTRPSLPAPLPRPVVLHVPIGKGCNNRCAFCMEHGRGAERRYDLGEIEQQMLRMRPHTDAVVFTSGEPTLSPLLPQGVALARTHGFASVGLVTNGRRLADRALLLALLDAGLDDLTISLHGPDAAVHDGITGRPGSFDQTVQGITHAGALRRERHFRLQVNCTVVRDNLNCLRTTFDLARRLGADAVTFNAVEPRGRAAEAFLQVVPRYAEIVEAAWASGIDFRSPEASLSRVPPCAGGPQWVQDDFHFAHAEQIRNFDPHEGMVCGPPCERCDLAPTCPGVWGRYVEGHGWEGMEPVIDPARRTGRALGAHDAQDLRRGYLAGYRRVRLQGTGGLPERLLLARSLGYDHVAVEVPASLLGAPRVTDALLQLAPDEVVMCTPEASRSALRVLARVRSKGLHVTLRLTR